MSGTLTFILGSELTGGSEMTALPRELRIDECRRLIADGGIGRVAFQSQSAQHIVPVNFQLDHDSIVFRTTPYSELGRLAPGSEAAFEVDELDVESTSGWSVVAKGRVDVIPDNFEKAAMRFSGKDPKPWAEGVRRLYMRLTWRELTGRRLVAPWWP
jgi:nitroimidazol reductase NimA-like FMN-containing flavoprotein (pyridoxamine 5'-phosphate oxidase superfamily)